LEKRLAEMKFWIFYLWGGGGYPLKKTLYFLRMSILFIWIFPFVRVISDQVLSNILKIKKPAFSVWKDLILYVLFLEVIVIFLYLILWALDKKIAK
jgi:hypothetical protein